MILPPSVERSKVAQWRIAALISGVAALLSMFWAGQSGNSTANSQVGRPDADQGSDAQAVAADVLFSDELVPPDAVTDLDAHADAQKPAEDAAENARGPLHIEAEPAELRVWANTRVRLRVESDDGQEFDKYIWHFEDGSEPVQGVEVEHVFAESVRDRHVTMEAFRGGVATVVTRRLPVERLEVVPLDGDGATPLEVLPNSAGTRLVVAGGTIDESRAAQVVRAADRADAELLIVAADAASAQAVSDAAQKHAPTLAILHWSLTIGAEGEASPPLTILRDPASKLAHVARGERDLGVLALGELAIVAADTRAETIAEPELKRVRDALVVVNAYHSSLLLSARPLTLMRDGELIADRAYRLYEHALRQQTNLVVSATSGVFYDGRFGGVFVVGIGAAQVQGCPHLLGSEACQVDSLSAIDVGARGQIAVRVLVGADFSQVFSRRQLPAEVGKIRR